MIPENSNEEVNALKNQVFALLLALIVISGTLMVTLYRQTSMIGKEIAQQDQAEREIAQFQANMGGVVGKLLAYGDKHPEFRPLLAKYGFAPAAGVPAGSPVPAAPKK